MAPSRLPPLSFLLIFLLENVIVVRCELPESHFFSSANNACEREYERTSGELKASYTSSLRPQALVAEGLIH